MATMKKLMSLVLSMVLLIAVLTGCTSKAPTSESSENSAATTPGTTTASPAENEKKVLSAWAIKSFNEAANQVMAARIEQYAKEKNVEVTYEFIGEQEYLTKYNAAVESGETPDVTYTRDDFLLSSYPNIQFLEVSDFIKELDAKRPMLQEYLHTADIDGKTYRVPFASTANPVIYRKDLFSKAGYETFPKTWKELFEACRKISQQNKGVYAFGLGGGVNENEGGAVWRWLMWDNGGGLFDKDGNVNATNPKNAEALQMYVDLYRDGAVPPSALTWDAGSNNKSYLSGESAMIFNAFTILSTLKGQGYEELLKNTAVAMVPAGPAGTFCDEKFLSYAIFKNSKNIDTAKDFLMYVYDKEWYNSWVGSLAPVFGPVFVDSTEDAIWKDPVNSILVQYAKIGTFYGFPCTSVNAMVAGAKVYNQYSLNEAMQKILVDKMSVEDALKWLQTEMEKIVAK